MKALYSTFYDGFSQPINITITGAVGGSSKEIVLMDVDFDKITPDQPWRPYITDNRYYRELNPHLTALREMNGSDPITMNGIIRYLNGPSTLLEQTLLYRLLKIGSADGNFYDAVLLMSYLFFISLDITVTPRSLSATDPKKICNVPPDTEMMEKLHKKMCRGEYDFLSITLMKMATAQRQDIVAPVPGVVTHASVTALIKKMMRDENRPLLEYSVRPPERMDEIDELVLYDLTILKFK